MRRMIGIWCVCGAFLMWSEARADSVLLVKGGQPVAEIVVAPEPPDIVAYAARELQFYVKKMSGAQLPMVTAPTDAAAHVFVGQSAHTRARGIAVDGLREDGFRIVVRDNWLALVGRDYAGKPYSSGAHPFRTAQTYNPELKLWAFGEAGSLFAVHEFLRGHGVRWYMPGDLGEVVPRTPTLAAAKGERCVEPHYRYRNPYFCDFPRAPDDARWYRRLGCGGAAPVFVNHTMQRVLRGQTEAHPDWFAMANGQRVLKRRGKYGHMPCLTSPGYRDAVVAWVRAYFDSKPNEAMCSVMPPDSFKHCTCPGCAAKLTPERGPRAEDSDLVWTFVDSVARDIKQSHPGKKVSCCAYARYLLPPAAIDRLSDNIVVMTCQSRSGFFQPEYRERILQVREQWQKALPGGDFYVWEYYLANRYHQLYGLPALFTQYIADDLRSLRDFAKGEFVECNKGPNRSLADPLLNNLNIYLSCRLYWDVDADVDALKEEYYSLFFGPAADTMKRFHDEAERIWMRPVPLAHRVRGGMRNLVKAGDVDRLFAILDEARAQATESPYRDRVELMRKDCQPLTTLYGAPPKGRPVVELTTVRNAPVKIDGKLEEPFWKGLALHQLRDNQTGGPPHGITRFRITRSNTHILIGVECDEHNMARVPMHATGLDSRKIWDDDVIEVFISTPVDYCFQWAFNARGASCDVNWAGTGDLARGLKWNSGHRVAAATHDKGWTLEIAIPIRSLDPRGGLRPTSQRPWRFNLYRTWQMPDGKLIYAGWSPTLKPFFRDTYLFGLLAFK